MSTTQVHDTYVGKHGEIPLGHYCRQSMVPYFDTDELVEVTKQGFAFFEDAFDFPYPFHKYDQLYVPEFNNGAMENAGCVTLRDEYLPRSRQATWFYEQRANTVLHEMAHMWFGDLVTMRWWDDLWLNESFAEWASHHALVEATKYDEAWTGFTNDRKNWAYRQDQLPSTHPIAADNHDLEAVEVELRRHHLRQGRLGAQAARRLGRRGRVLRRAAGLLPPARVRQLRVHRPARGARGDLRAATCGRGPRSGCRPAASTRSRPTSSVDDDGRYTSFARAADRAPGLPDAAPAPHRRRPLRPRRGRPPGPPYDGRDRRRAAPAPTSPSWSASSSPTCCCSTTATCPTPRSASTSGRWRPCVESIHRIDDSLARALCWGALWDMTRDAELRRRDFVALVLPGLGAESDETAVKQLPVYVQIAIDQFAHPGQARRAAGDVGDGACAGCSRHAEPGSDHQLTFVKSFAGTTGKRIPPSSYGGAARSEEGLDLLAGLLDGSVRLEGLDVDTDLRWALLTALAGARPRRRGRVPRSCARDNTISGPGAGRRRARGACPTAETKAQAWQTPRSATTCPTRPSAASPTSSTCSEQEEVLAPYLEKYLDGRRDASGRTRAPRSPRRCWSTCSRGR